MSLASNYSTAQSSFLSPNQGRSTGQIDPNAVTITANPLLPTDALLSDPQVVQKFLQFCLSQNDRALMPVDNISEIVTVRVPEILPVPQMRDCVLGVYNWRGEMLWIVDLGEFLGFASMFGKSTKPQTAITIVIEYQEQTIGFVVPQVLDLEMYNIQQIQAPDSQLFPPNILPFLSGFFIDDRNDILILLNIAAIFSSLQQSL